MAKTSRKFRSVYCADCGGSHGFEGDERARWLMYSGVREERALPHLVLLYKRLEHALDDIWPEAEGLLDDALSSGQECFDALRQLLYPSDDDIALMDEGR